MFDLFDLLLLRRGTPADDRTLRFRRIDGSATAKVIYFLPWHTRFAVARQAGFTPLDFLACYEMPLAIVSSVPELCARAMQGLVADAESLLQDRAIRGQDAVIVGLSVGTYPATYLANRIGARLCSVASADRADLAIWESPATRMVKHRAIQNGLQLSDYSMALDGTHPVQNLKAIARDSIFVVGQRDPFIPACRNAGLLQAIETQVRSAHVIKLDGGHFQTLRASGQYQREMLGLKPARTGLPVRIPTFGRLAIERASKDAIPRP